MTGMCANASRAALAPDLSKRLLGQEFGYLEELHFAPGDLAAPRGDGLRHFVNVPVHAVKDHVNFGHV